MTQKNLKSTTVAKQRSVVNSVTKSVESNVVYNVKFDKNSKTPVVRPSVFKTVDFVQNKEQKTNEIWDDLDVIPPRPEYPDNLPDDNVDAVLHLMNLNK